MFYKKEIQKMPKGNKKKEKEKSSKITVSMIVVPLLIASILSALLYIVVSKASDTADLSAPVVVVKKDVEANGYIAKKDYDTYFEEVVVVKGAISDSCYTSMKDLPEKGMYVASALDEKEFLYKKDVVTSNKKMKNFSTECDITSIAADNFSSAVCGSLRAGDVVDIYAKELESDNLMLYASGVLIKAAYDSNGEIITEEEGSATSFSIYVSEEQKAQVNAAIASGGIQLYKKK